ncbi:hypothetical protein ABPG72_005773 [Tetrahymena utriculariae]
MRLSSSSFFPQIEPKSLKTLNRGSTQDENSFNKPRSSKLIQSTEIFGQPFKNKSNILQVDNKKRASITLGGSQKEIIKTLSEKLDEHQYLIDSRNLNIEELENQVKLIKVELQNEKIVVQVKTEQNLKLQDTNEKLNSRIRVQTQKFDDLQVKFSSLEQDFKTVKELEKSRMDQWSIKEQSYQKKVAELESKLSSQKEDSKSKAKNALLEAQKQINELQSQIKSLEQSMEKAKIDLNIQEEKIKTLDKDKLQYCSEALELRQKCSYQKGKLESQSNETHNLKEQNKQLLQEQQALQAQINELKKSQLMLGDLKSQTQRYASDFEKQVQQNKDQIQRLEADIEGFKKQDKERVEEIKTLKLYIEKKDQKIVSLTDFLKQEKLQKGAESKDKEVILKEVQDLKEVIKSLNENVNSVKQKEQVFKVNVDKLEKGEQEILKSLKCNYCSKFIKEPITIIPCGHSFCFQCKKAYAKDCIKCGPKVKVEAMYRNELLDDIITMYKTMNSVKESLIYLIKMK